MSSSTGRVMRWVVAMLSLGATVSACGSEGDLEQHDQVEVGERTQALMAGRHFWARVRNGVVSQTQVYHTTNGTITATNGRVGEYEVKAQGRWNTTVRGNAQVTALGPGGEHCGFIIAPLDDPTGDIRLWVICSLNGVHKNTDFLVQYTQAGNATPSTPAAYLTSLISLPSRIDHERSWNSTGGTNRVTRANPGSYIAWLPGLARTNGTVQISTILNGAHDGRYCHPYDAGDTNPTDKVVGVVCFDRNGAPADANFTLNYFGPGQIPANNKGAFVYADQSNAASYVPSSSPTYITPAACLNAQSSNLVTRSGTGMYTVHHAGFPPSQAAPFATAFSTSSKFCKVDAIRDGAPSCSVDVTVRCFTAMGTPADVAFYESFSTPFQ